MLPIEFAIICAGGELPTALLQHLGIQVDRHYGGVGREASPCPRGR